jgi:hypothetical protein
MKLNELRRNSCRFIEGEAGYDSDYCGRECVPTTPWCIKHLRIVTPKAETIIRRELNKWENERNGTVNREVRIAQPMTDREAMSEDGERTKELV